MRLKPNQECQVWSIGARISFFRTSSPIWLQQSRQRWPLVQIFQLKYNFGWLQKHYHISICKELNFTLTMFANRNRIPKQEDSKNYITVQPILISTMLMAFSATIWKSLWYFWPLASPFAIRTSINNCIFMYQCIFRHCYFHKIVDCTCAINFIAVLNYK